MRQFNKVMVAAAALTMTACAAPAFAGGHDHGGEHRPTRTPGGLLGLGVDLGGRGGLIDLDVGRGRQSLVDVDLEVGGRGGLLDVDATVGRRGGLIDADAQVGRRGALVDADVDVGGRGRRSGGLLDLGLGLGRGGVGW